MTELIPYCRLHGIVIDSPPPIGIWRRYPTEDHPNSRNGAVKFMGTHAFIQNWATGTDVAVWHADNMSQADIVQIQRVANDAEAQRKRQQAEAARKAAWIMDQCQIGKHDYLKAKGFPEDQGNVWAFSGQQLLVIGRVYRVILDEELARLCAEAGLSEQKRFAENVLDRAPGLIVVLTPELGLLRFRQVSWGTLVLQQDAV